jgi:glyoxylase-like metal-dependent hydrolase (beta-lactamase superfamily II)
VLTAPEDDPYEVIAIQYGTRDAMASEVYLHYGLYHEPDREIGMAYYFWLIRNSARTILVDCGFSPEGGAKRDRTMLCSPLDALQKLGVEVDDIDLFVITHAHYDHIGNLKDFADLPLVISRTEYDFWTSPIGLRPLFLHSAEESEIAELTRRVQAGQVTFFDGSHTVAPGIELIEVGGHTPGQSILTIDQGERQVILASDALHYYEELDRDWPFAHLADLAQAYQALDTLRELSSNGTATMVPGHEPAVMTRFPRVDGALRDLAVVVS